MGELLTLLESMLKIDILSEGWKDVYQQFVDTGKVPEEVFQRFREADPSGKQKYLLWAVKQYTQDSSRVSHIVDVMKLFHEQVERGVIKKDASDIYQYSLDQADELAQQSGATKTKGEVKQQTKSESSIVAETDDYLIVVPESHGASCFYGANTKWCTSSKTSQHWDMYWKAGVKIYIVIDKRKNKKYAVAVHKDGQMEAFDEQDKSISIQKIEKAIGVSIEVDVAKPATSKELGMREQEHLEDLLKQGTKNPDGSYSFVGDVDLGGFAFQKLPVRFKDVGGKFQCSGNQLTTLEGAPQTVGSVFSCGKNQLTSLEGAPQIVGGNFYCYDNQLTTLEGAPQKVGGDFFCYGNQLTSLEGAPQIVGGSFYCYDNQLTTLEGAPQIVGGNFYCNSNPVSKEQLKATVDRDYLHR